MKLNLKTLLLATTVATVSISAQADDIEGKIEAINAEAQSFVVQGITFFTETTTDYDDGLKTFADLKVGQNVEVDFEYRDKRHIATEIELEK
ncbi:serine protease inhibitor ecotin [Rheinheimera pacifica]|uniref:DUF5666 domain-containing protein n=1 Tax=Rheinheimera pacifica TaxID=173990 RepID=UPI002167CE8F|nr:DUF5666 domain-containing protein [Rheinheimera pacifica]MCS4308047.1 serine protease inhibitor ecotin [Rheinheimera pacifica]